MISRSGNGPGKLLDARKKSVERIVRFGDSCQVCEFRERVVSNIVMSLVERVARFTSDVKVGRKSE